MTQSNDPLYIVDGFQVDNINDIPPTDIASIDVLKMLLSRQSMELRAVMV